MSKLRRVIAIIVALYLLAVLLDRFVLVSLFFTRTGIPLIVAAFEVLALIGCGFATRCAVARRWDPENADIARDLLIGYPIFGTICFLIGTIYIGSWLMGAVLVGAAVGGIYVLVRRFEIRPLRWSDIQPPPLAIGLVFIAGIVLAQAPPTSLDELAYHLAVPWEWVKEGRAIALPLLSHSYFPLGIESADIPSLAMLGTTGGLASHWLHLFAAIATAVIAWRVTRGSILGTAAIVATPALAITAGWSTVDWPLTGICLLTYAALEEDDDLLLACAIAAGLLTKYTFIPFALIVVLATRRWRWKALAIGAAIGSIFFLRNLILTGNPLAPFFSPLAPHVNGYRGAPFLSDYIFEGHFVDEALGASMLALMPLTAGVACWVLVATGVALFLLAPSARILLPFFVIPAAVGARSLDHSRTVRIIAAVAVIVQLVLVAYYVDRNNTFALVSGGMSDDDYLTKARPSYVTANQVDALLADNPLAVILLIGENETFWFVHRVRGAGNFDGPRISAYLALPTPEALYARLKHDGITHVAIVGSAPPTNVEQKVEERTTTLSPDAQRMLARTLDRYGTNVTARGNATVFVLK